MLRSLLNHETLGSRMEALAGCPVKMGLVLLLRSGMGEKRTFCCERLAQAGPGLRRAPPSPGRGLPTHITTGTGEE